MRNYVRTITPPNTPEKNKDPSKLNDLLLI